MSDTPKTVAEWVRYLHRAAAIPKGHADYPDAREAVQFALDRIRNINTAANAADAQDVAQSGGVQSPVQGIGVGLLHGLSLGAGEPIAGAISAIRGKGFSQGAQAYREGLGRVQETAPNATAFGDVAGTALQAAFPVERGVTGGKQLATAIIGRRPGAVGRFFHGALQANITPAAVLGGIAGFSAGGEDPGDFKARGITAATTATLSALLAGVVSGAASVTVPRYRMKEVTHAIQQALGKDASPAVVDGITEAAVRKALGDLNVTPDVLEQSLVNWRRTGKLTIAPPETSVRTRPGETITQTSPRGFEVNGVRETPPVPTTPTIGEMIGGFGRSPDIGRGKTLPYAPRGGAVEQSFGVQPASSPAVPGMANPTTQTQAFADFLRQSPPTELAGRIQTLKDLGILPPGGEAELLQYLTRGSR